MSEIKRLLNSLLWEIYGQNPSSISNRQKRMHPKLYEPRLLQKLSTNILNDICGILQLEIRLMSKYLERVLISRDKNRTHNTILYGFLDVIVSSRLGEPSREMRFSLSPPPGAVTGRPDPGRSSQSSDEANSSSDFNQWLHAMKMVARLPGGMPPEFRRKLWLALSDKYLKSKNVDWEKEEIKCFSEQWREDDEELGIQIVKDLHRTGSSLCSGPAGTINQAKLKRILLGYARYNPEVGYCQGFNMLGALILQVMDKEEIESIKVMIYLVEGILPGGYFSGSLGGLQADMAVFRELMTSKLPRLAKHLQKLQGPVENAFEPPLTNVFTMQWFLTMFCTCLPMTCVLRVWDLVLIEGSDVLLRTALVLWSLLEERILNARTADDFYCKMGSFSSELLNGHLIDSNGLIEKVVELGPIPELQKLRDKHLYNITPFRDKKGLQLYYSDEEGDSDEDSRMAVATAWGLRLSRRGSAGLSQRTDGKDRIALDISLLKKQYDRLRERQRQAHIILTSAVARQGSNPNQSSIQMNQLLIGRNAIVTNNGRRLGPPQGAIPPARKPSLPTAKISKPAQTKTLRRGETLHWRDTDLSKRRRGSLKWKDIKSDSSQSGQDDRGSQLIESAPSSRSSSSEPKSQKTSLKARQRSDSSSYSEDSDGNSSTSTSLCDEDDHEVGNVSSLEGSPLKKSKSSKKHSEVPHKKCLEDVLNSNDKHHSTDSQIPFIQLTTMDSPVMNANKTEIDSLEYAKEDSDTESNRLDYAGFVDEYSWPDMNESTSSAPPEDITVDVTSEEGDFLSLSNVITSTSQLSPIPDIATYINNSSISPLRTPISAFDYANLVVSMEESKKFDINDEGVTNEYFERVNIVERPTKLDLLYSLNEEDSIRNAYKTQSSETSPEQLLHKDLDLSNEDRLGDSSEFLASKSCSNNFKPSSEELDRKMKVLLEYSNQSSLSFIAEAKHEISSGMFKGKEFDPLSLKYQTSLPLSADEKSEKAALKSPSNENPESPDVDATLKSEANMSEIKAQSSSTSSRPSTEGDLHIQDQIEPCEAPDLKSTEIAKESIEPDTPAIENETEGIVCHIPSTEDLELRFKALEMNFSDRKIHSANDSESESKPTGQNKFSEIKTESNLSAPATLKSPISDLATTAVLQTDEGASSSPIRPQHFKQDSDLNDRSHPTLEEEYKKNDGAVSSSQCQLEVVQSSYLAEDETREFVPDQDSNGKPSTYSKDDINRHSLSYDHIHSVKESQIEKDKSEIHCSIEVSELNESVVPEKDSDRDRVTVLSGKYETDLFDEFKQEKQVILKDSKPDVFLVNSVAEADEPIIEKEAKVCSQEETLTCGSIVLPTRDESGETVTETSSAPYISIHSVMGVPEVDELVVLKQTKDNQLDVVNRIESKDQEVKDNDSSQLHNNMDVSEVDESEGLEQTPSTVTLLAEDQSDLDKECNLGESLIENYSSIDRSGIQSAQSVSEVVGLLDLDQAKDNVGPIALCTKVQSNPVIKRESCLDESRTSEVNEALSLNEDSSTRLLQNDHLEVDLERIPSRTGSTIEQGEHQSHLGQKVRMQTHDVNDAVMSDQKVKVSHEDFPTSPLAYSQNHFGNKPNFQSNIECTSGLQRSVLMEKHTDVVLLDSPDTSGFEDITQLEPIEVRKNEQNSSKLLEKQTDLVVRRNLNNTASISDENSPLNRLSYSEDHFGEKHTAKEELNDQDVLRPTDEKPSIIVTVPIQKSGPDGTSLEKKHDPLGEKSQKPKIPSTEDLESRFKALERQFSEKILTIPKESLESRFKAPARQFSEKNIVIPKDSSELKVTKLEKQPSEKSITISKDIKHQPNTQSTKDNITPVKLTDSDSSGADIQTTTSSVQIEVITTKSIPTTADLEHRFRELERKLSSKSINVSSKTAPPQQDDLKALRQSTIIAKPSIVLPNNEDTTPTNPTDTSSLTQTTIGADAQPPFIRKRIPSTEDLEIRFEALEIQKSLKSPTAMTTNTLSPSRSRPEFSIESPEMDTASKRKSDIPSIEDLENRFQALEQRKLVENSAQHETDKVISKPDCTIPTTKDLENRFNALDQRKSVANDCTKAKNSEDKTNLLEKKGVPQTPDLQARFEVSENQSTATNECTKEKHNSPEIKMCSDSKYDVQNEKSVPSTQDLETRYEALEQQKASMEKCTKSGSIAGTTVSNIGHTAKGVPSTQDLETRFEALEQRKSISSDLKTSTDSSDRNEKQCKKLPSTQDLETRFEALEQRKSATEGCLKKQISQDNAKNSNEIRDTNSKLPTTPELENKFDALDRQKSFTDGCFKNEELDTQKASKVPSTHDLETRFEALKHQKPTVIVDVGQKKLSKVPSTQDLEKRFAVMQIDTDKLKVDTKHTKADSPSKTETDLKKVQTDDTKEIPDQHKRRDLYKLESQSDETLTATDQTSTEFETKVESRPTSCPEYSDPFDSNIVTTDRVLKIIEENSKILHRILKKTLADTGDQEAKDQTKKSHPGLTDSLLALGNIFPRSDETISPSHIKSHSWIRPSITLRSDDNISDRLASIKSTIKSIDTLCEEKSFRKEKCQRYIDSLFARPTLTAAAVSANPSIMIDDFERKPSQDRIAKREQKKDISPRRRRDEDREEYESRVRRDTMPNSLDAPSDFSFSVANIDQVDSELDRINQEKQVDTQIERPLSPYYGSGYDLNKRSITPVVYIPTKLEIRHTTVTSTFYDRYLTEKHIERTFPRSKKSPVSPTTTKSYLDIAKYSSTNFNDRSSKSAENSPSRRKDGGGLSPNYTISSTANRRSMISTLEVAQKDLQIRSCDNILLQLRSSTHNTDIVPSIMVYNPLPTKIRKPPELGISLGLYKDYGSDESSKS